MGLFSKKDKVRDYTDAEGVARNKKLTEKRGIFSHSGIKSKSDSSSTTATSQTSQASDSNYSPFPFFAGNTDSSSSTGYSEEESLSDEERKRRLGKRLLDMTNRIEDLSNQIYHLQQRIELLERKSGNSSSSSDGWGY